MIGIYQKNDPYLLDPRGTNWGGMRTAAGDTAFQFASRLGASVVRPRLSPLHDGFSPRLH